MIENSDRNVRRMLILSTFGGAQLKFKPADFSKSPNARALLRALESAAF